MIPPLPVVRTAEPLGGARAMAGRELFLSSPPGSHEAAKLRLPSMQHCKREMYA
jgi:hypothetical protein